MQMIANPNRIFKERNPTQRRERHVMRAVRYQPVPGRHRDGLNLHYTD